MPTYIQWNNALAKFFFNERKAEKEVFLFITRQNIANIGKELGVEGNNQDIFNDFLNAIKFGIPGKQPEPVVHLSPIQQPFYLYKAWKESPTSFEYPLYIGYLAAYILPLTESANPDYNWNNYYGRVNDFFRAHEILNGLGEDRIGTHNFHVIDDLWKDLEEWSIIEKNTTLGYFELHPFLNARWIHVGKPISQCVFPQYSVNNLPNLFAVAGLVPGDEIENNQFRMILLKYGKELLWLPDSVLNSIRDSDNEIGHSIINIVKNNYIDWNGITDLVDAETDTVKKGNTIAQLRLSLEINYVNKVIRSYFRLHTILDYPEDLKFNGTYNCSPQGKGWSKPLNIPFVEGLEVEDSLNRWKAKITDKDIRLLIEGKNFHLSGWVEVPYMMSGTKMLIVSKGRFASAIDTWGSFFDKGDFKRLDFTGLPAGYVLYEIRNPPIDHPDIPALKFKLDKRLLLTGGIKIGTRKWQSGILPEVELENGRGNETVYLTYENNIERISLERKEVSQPVWKLPSNIELDNSFYIKVAGFELRGDKLKNEIVSNAGHTERLDNDFLPKRDEFGQIIQTQNDDTVFVTGSKISNNFFTRSILIRQDACYSNQFRPIASDGTYQLSDPLKSSGLDDLLLTFLTIKGRSDAKEYFEAFEAVYHERFTPEEIESHPVELSKLKRWSLNYLDYMGFLDYEYSTTMIAVNPPQLILIPTHSGRKALLIGGRTPEFLDKFYKTALQEGLQVNLQYPDASLVPFILPITVSLTGFDEKNPFPIENKIINIAKKCSIIFEREKFVQFALAEFSCDIHGYERQLKVDARFDDNGWNVGIFDTNRLKFISTSVKLIDKSFSLVEYKLNEYRFKHKLWKGGKSYDIDKNWGRYISLNKAGRHVIFNDRTKEVIAIPAAAPLPRLIAEAMTLFSGRSPMRKLVEINGWRTWFNIYENIPHIFAYNYFKKVGQTIIETSIETL